MVVVFRFQYLLVDSLVDTKKKLDKLRIGQCSQVSSPVSDLLSYGRIVTVQKRMIFAGLGELVESERREKMFKKGTFRIWRQLLVL